MLDDLEGQGQGQMGLTHSGSAGPAQARSLLQTEVCIDSIDVRGRYRVAKFPSTGQYPATFDTANRINLRFKDRLVFPRVIAVGMLYLRGYSNGRGWSG